VDEYSHYPEALALVQKVAEEDKEYFVREDALSYLAKHFPRDSGVFQFLCRQAIVDPNSYIRSNVLRNIISCYPGQREIMALLMTVAEKDSESVNRLEAIEQLAKLCPERSGLLEFLDARLKREQAPWVREEIEKLLAGLKGGSQ